MTPVAPSALLVPTKLRAPQPSATWVRRERLLARLGAEREARLTLVVAPAGFGKSTLVAQWLADSGPARAYAWLTLDEYDQDGRRFLSYLAGAIEQATQDSLPTTRPLLAAPDPPPLYVIVQALLVDLAALPAELTLILDDYHTIAVEEVHQTVAYLIRHLPPRCTMLILSRIDPPLPLARLRAEQQLVEVRVADLRFTAEEAGAMLATLLGHAPEPARVAALHEETEGWAIALQLAGLARTGWPATDHGSSLVRGQIAEYLAEEVLRQQPAAVQAALLALAVPERVCASLAAELLELPGGELEAEELLRQLVRMNLFLLPLDAEWGWFRLHHLFRDLLLRRLLITQGEARARELRLRAANWLGRAGYLEEAVRLFLAADAESAAADLAQRALLAEVNVEVVGTQAVQRLQQLPRQLVASHPGLALIEARVGLQKLNVAALAAALERVDRLLAAPARSGAPPPWPSFATDLAALGGLLHYFQYRPADAIPILEAVLEQPGSLGLAEQLLLVLGRSYVAVGRYEEGVQRIAEQRGGPGSGWAQVSELTRLVGLAIMHGLAGRLDALARNDQRLSALLAVGPASNLLVGYATAGVASRAYERSELAAATTQFQLLASRKYRVSYSGYMFGIVGLTMVAIAEGDLARAEEFVQEALDFAGEEGGALLKHQALGCATLLALARGDAAAALRSAEPIERDMHLGLSLAMDTPRLTQVRALIAVGGDARLARADSLLAGCLAEVEAFHNVRLQIRTYALLALLRQAQGRSAEALSCLERAVGLAAPLGFVRSFVDLGTPLQPLLRALASRGLDQAYLERIVRAGAMPAEPQAQVVLASPVSGLPELLTRRELEILGLLGARWSDKEIAEQLTIALTTVRKHTSTIYGKLGVAGRRQAVALARALGLLPAER